MRKVALWIEMKIAVISDIHGNYKAFVSCMEYLEKHAVDHIFFLGDFITDCPYPQRLLALLYETLQEKNCFWVRGNREEYVLENKKQDKGWKKSSGTGALLYVSERLKSEDYRFFEKAPTVLRPAFAGLPETTLCHGIPEDTRGNLGEQPYLLDIALKQANTKYLFGGHSHKQEMRRTEQGIYINPGSLGIAIDGVGKRAQFAVVQVEKGEYQVELVSIPYDWQGLLHDFAESGIEEYGKVQVRSVKKTLVTGVNFFFECVKLAVQLSGGMDTAQIPEEVWERAAKELGI